MTFERINDADLFRANGTTRWEYIVAANREIDRLLAEVESRGQVCKDRFDRIKALEAEMNDRIEAVSKQVTYTDSAGIRTYRGLPVVVPVGLVPEGETPIRVGRPSTTERFVSEAAKSYATTNAYQPYFDDHPFAIRIILTDKPQTPLFELGKCYRNKLGEVRGPLSANDNCEWCLCDGARSYRSSGSWDPDGLPDELDLLPGEVAPVPTWTPWPWLPDGEYRVSTLGIETRGIYMDLSYAARLRGFTERPPIGRWSVASGVATWLGEAT